jgi:exonuclease SbcD
MRFLHTADWHLGRIFHNVHLTNDQAYILADFVAVAKDSRPDAIIIAGDVYDRAVPPPEAVELLDDILCRILLDLKIPVIAIAGNHDSPERLGFGERLLTGHNLHLVGQPSARIVPIVLQDEYGPVYFCPIPYAEPAVVRDRLQADAQSHEQAMEVMLATIGGTVPAKSRKVAVCHAFVAGGVGCESERPLAIGAVPSVNAAVFDDFQFVALGHLHQAQQVGQPKVHYSGSLMKYSFSEANHRKTVSLVEMDGSGNIQIERIALKVKRDVRCIHGCLEDLLRDGGSDHRADDYLLVTLDDTGALLDPMGKLRQVYPNVMQLDRTALHGNGEGQAATAGDHRRQSETKLFSSFFGQVTGQDLNADEQTVFAKLLDDFNRRKETVL